MLRNRTAFSALATIIIVVIVFFVGRTNAGIDSSDPIRPDQKTLADFNSTQPATIKEFHTANIDPDEKPCQYAVVDLDDDGREELLVEYDRTGDIAIFSTQNGTPYSYRIPYRSCLNLKTDGTMGWSNSASESGVKRLTFSDGAISDKDIIVYNTEKGIFMLNEKPVTEEVCVTALREHWNKPNVKWIPIR